MKKLILLLMIVFMASLVSAIDNGLLLYWKGDNDMTDSSNNSIDMSALNGTALYGAGKVGSASFNMTGGGWKLGIDNNTVFGTKVALIKTCDFWIKVEKTILVDKLFLTFSDNTANNRHMFNYEPSPKKLNNQITVGGGAAKWTYYVDPIDFFPVDTWRHVIWIQNGSGTRIHLDGNTTAGGSTVSTDSMTTAFTYLDIGTKYDDSQQVTALIDNLACFDYPYSSTNITDSWNNGDGRDFTPTVAGTPTFNEPANTPQTNNTNIIFNVSCSNFNATLYFNNSGTIYTITNGSTTVNWGSNATSDGSYGYWAQCGTGANSSIRTWSLDQINPRPGWNTNSSASIDNTSLIYDRANFIVSFNASDSRDLDEISVLIRYRNISGTIYWNYTNTTLSGTSFAFSNTTDIDLWPSGQYFINMTVSDSHNPLVGVGYDIPMDKELYQVINTKESELNFITKEGNNIRIYSDQEVKLETIRLKNKYEILATYKKDWLGNVPKEKVYYIKSEQNIKYKPNSPYKGHFIVGNPLTGSGNFIDFEEEIGSVEVEEKRELFGFGKKYYKVIVNNPSNIIRYHSIGGLNFGYLVLSFNLSRLNTTSALITPPVALDNENLLGYCSGDDDLENNFGFNYRWYNGSNIFSNGSYPSGDLTGATILVDTISSGYTGIGQEWVLSCQANNSLFNASWVNSSSVEIINISIDNCSTFTNFILNFTYSDEGAESKLTVDKVGYDLTFTSSVGDIKLNGTIYDTSNNSFCTNVNTTIRNLTWDTTGQILIEKSLYATRLFDIGTPFSASNLNPYVQNINMILLNESSTVIITWLTTAYESISGTMLVYQCRGDGSRFLVESTPIINGEAVINIELINSLYSYEIVVDGELFTDITDFTKCHIEPSTERTFIVNIGGIDVAPTLGLYSITCNLTKGLSNTVNMTWGLNPENDATITGCMQAFRHSITGTTKVFESCDTDFSIIATVPLSGYDYSVSGKLFQNGYSISCNEILEFKNDNTTPNLLGLTGLIAIFFLFVGMVLLFNQDSKEQLLGLIVALIIAFITGWLAFGWQTISAIISFIIVIMLIGRHSRKP